MTLSRSVGGKFTFMFWAGSLCLVALIGLSTGCMNLKEPNAPSALAETQQPATEPVERTGTLITKDAAMEAVRQQPKVVQYEESLKASGYKLFLGVEETPSRFIIRVGEDRSDKVTVARWYLVDKKDGKVTEWKIADGEPPKD